MQPIEIIQIPQLRDNYAYVLICRDTGQAAVVDSPGAEPVINAIERRGAGRHDVRLVAIFNTHHHWDHVGANAELLARWPTLRVYGHVSDQGRIPGLTDPVQDRDTVRLGGHTACVLFVPGHTSGHVAYHFAEDGVVFVGDTMFGAGCGRLLEGTPAQMTRSLRDVLGALPPETVVYCAHEYTEADVRFALTIEPGNVALRERAEAVRAARGAGHPTVPFTLDGEWATNPFMRLGEPALRRAAATHGVTDTDDPVEVLAAIREMKDEFRG